ncbi:MAG: LbtU family siderophore porin [Gammaproteobacteria bacterium]|nr:LbtU family siderophore porin [Gammaproteobacteria bacterium]
MNTINLKTLSAATLTAMAISTTPAMAEPTLEVSGAIEVEMNSGKDQTASTKGSDIALATVEIGFDAQINENVTGHILVLHEDDDTDPPVIDEGFITISSGVDPSASPGHHRPGSPREISAEDDMYIYLTAGRMYVPFGNFESHMISDPLTLELGETQEAAIRVGFATGGLHASIYAFNGNSDQVDTDPTVADNDVVDDFGISIGYSMKTGSMELALGFDYINNMAETDGLEGALLAGPTIQEHTAGMAVHAIINMDALTVIFEHVAAMDDFNTVDLQFNGAKASPSATNIEAAYSMKMGERDYTFAIAHQSTGDIDGSALPESRNMFSVSTTVANDVAFAVELSNASDYETTDGGTGESGSMITAQLAVEF